MKHLFVPYSLALLAKEKGFNEQCLAVYHTDDKSIAPVVPDKPFTLSGWANSDESSGRYLAAPLYQQLVDWFREDHLLYIVFNVPNNEWRVEELPPESRIHLGSGTLDSAIEQAFKLI